MSTKEHKYQHRQSLIRRYRSLPKDLHSRKFSVRNRAQRLLTLTICIPLMLAALFYIVHWFEVKSKIDRDNEEYKAMYCPEDTVPTETYFDEPKSAKPSSPLKTQYSAITSSPEPTAIPTQTPIVTEIPTPAETPTPSPVPTATSEPVSEPTMDSTLEPLAPIAEDELLIVNSTPNTDTVVYSIQTPPPVQESFKSLLETNSDTIGYLTIGSQISLPVVQRYNDNEYYLSHNLRGEESEGGTLFLDGSNLLIPEDPVLLVYGHNMKNGTMFQPLTCFERVDYLRSNPVIRFDTIYGNKRYMPVAVFTESVDPESEGYVNIRQFSFDETLWELYVLKLEKLSIYDMDINASYGDHLLLLVTCEYTHENGRLVVVFRELRSNETEETARQLLSNVKLKN